jgi:hypothetical protein
MAMRLAFITFIQDKLYFLMHVTEITFRPALGNCKTLEVKKTEEFTNYLDKVHVLRHLAYSLQYFSRKRSLHQRTKKIQFVTNTKSTKIGFSAPLRSRSMWKGLVLIILGPTSLPLFHPCVSYVSQFDQLTLRRGTEDALAIEPLRLAARCFSRSHLYSNWGRGSSGGLGTSTPALPISRTDTRRHFLSSSSVNTTILFTHWPLRCNNT